MRRIVAILAGLALVVVPVGAALACGGLVAPNGSVNLVRTATLAAYHNGVEHYVTSFEFAGKGKKFGSLVPLPGVPFKVTRGGKWTLQRLEQEVAPPAPQALAGGAAAEDSSRAKVLYETQIDGLRITILKGGGNAVGRWAANNGFNLPPDAPEVLRFYAERSPIFMAAKFIPKAAERNKLSSGDGIPIHLRIRTDNPWVPLRILALGKLGSEVIDADVFLLTDDRPAILPEPSAERGLFLERSERASQLLMDDLRSDKGMKWMPKSSPMWLSFLRISAEARDLTYDLAVDATGAGQPSAVDAGLEQVGASSSTEAPQSPETSAATLWAIILVPLLGIGTVAFSKRKVMPNP